MGSKPNNKRLSGIDKAEALVGNLPVRSKTNSKKQSGGVSATKTEAVPGHEPVAKVAATGASTGSNNNKRSPAIAPEAGAMK